MKRTTALGVFVLALAVVFLTASVPGAFAQDPKGGGGAGGAGASAPRGGGGDGGGGARGGGVSSAPAPSSSGGSGGGPVFSGGGGMSGGSPSGMSAVPRGANRGNENAGGRDRGVASPRYGGGAAAGGHEGRVSDAGAYRRSPTDDQMAGRSRTGAASSGVESSVPWYARPRGGNPSTGTAVDQARCPASQWRRRWRLLPRLSGLLPRVSRLRKRILGRVLRLLVPSLRVRPVRGLRSVRPRLLLLRPLRVELRRLRLLGRRRRRRLVRRAANGQHPPQGEAQQRRGLC